MAYLFSYAAEPSVSDRTFPEERLFTHLLRTAANATPEPFKSLAGDHPVDVYQSANAFELRTDAPGLAQDNIIVEVHEDVLKIAAKADAGPKDKTTTSDKSIPVATPAVQNHSSTNPWKVLRQERTGTQSWMRAFLLPDNANADGISVRLDKGMLTVHIPTQPPPPKSQPRRIAISS